MARRPQDASCDLLDLACACAATRRAARALTVAYDSRLRPHGIETAQFALLSTVAGMGPCTQASVGRALGLDKTTLSRNLRVLVRAGWVVAGPGESARDQRVEVTAQGRRVLVEARPAWQAAQDTMRAAMSAAEWREMHRLLRTLTEAAIRQGPRAAPRERPTAPAVRGAAPRRRSSAV